MLQRSFTFADLDSVRRPPPSNERELMLRAEALEGVTLGSLAGALKITPPTSLKYAKGWIGRLAETVLGSDPAAGEQPDFPQLGIELKTVPIARGLPAETTYACKLDHRRLEHEDWEGSRFRAKLRRVLWLPITDGPLSSRIVLAPRLWTMTPEWEERFRTDWENLIGQVASGSLPNGGEGEWMQLRPKALNARERVIAGAEGEAMVHAPMGLYLRRATTAEILAEA